MLNNRNLYCELYKPDMFSSTVETVTWVWSTETVRQREHNVVYDVSV